jgi:periplasmic protein TonB
MAGISARRRSERDAVWSRRRGNDRPRSEPGLAAATLPPKAQPAPCLEQPLLLFAPVTTVATAGEFVESEPPSLLVACRDHVEAREVGPIAAVRLGGPVVGSDAPAVGAAEPVSAVSIGDRPVRRVSLSLVASVLLHASALALALYLGLQTAESPNAGDDAVAVEIVSGDEGAAAMQETASGAETSAHEDATATTQTVEAPPTTEPEPQIQPPPPPTVTAEVKPPEPETPVAEAAPPEPQMPETPVAEAPPPEPQPLQAVAEAPAPVVPPEPAPLATPEPTEIQAMVAPTPPPPEPPPPAPPVVRHEPRPVRPVPPQPRRTQATERHHPQRHQTASRRSAPAGEGTGTRNSQASTGHAAGGSPMSAAAMANYRQRVLAHLARFKIYPDQARDRGIVGRAVVAFTLTTRGQLTVASLAGSSGAPILDQATLAMVRRAQPFPAPPEGSPSSVSFTAGIRYDLR